MNERRRRGVLWTVVLALALSLCLPKGHETPPSGDSVVAFLHGRIPGTRAVRIAGEVPHPGVYGVAPPATVRELVRQAAPGLAGRLTGAQLSTPLAGGDVVTITGRENRGMTVMRDSMTARERIVLGIPLDPARMTAADWVSLPGIGPAMARRIMTYGRERGGLHRVDDLLGVDGMGGQRVEKLRPLFDGSFQNPGVRSQERSDVGTTTE